MRRVWIEIKMEAQTASYLVMSPSMRRVWIEIHRGCAPLFSCWPSPSMRRVWIEILAFPPTTSSPGVTLHAEGVD